MKSLWKRTAAAMAGMMVLASAGCATKGDGEGTAKSGGDEINIRVASVYVDGHSMNKVFTDVLNEFKEKHPNVKITEEFMPSEQLQPKLKTDAASDNLPDIFPVWVSSDNINDIEAGLWMNMGETLDADSEWKNSFSPGFLEQFQYEGVEGNWAVPLCSYGVGFYYNKEVFEKAGAEVPETWDDLLVTIEKLKAAGATPWAIGAKDMWRSEHLFTNIYYRMNGIDMASKLTDKSIAYDDPSFLNTFQKMKDLVDAGAFDPSAVGMDYSQEVADFAAGNVGMQLNGTWGIGETDGPDTPDTIKGKIGYFAFPEFAGSEQYANNWMGGVNDAFAVSAKLEGEKKDLVMELMKSLSSTETAKRIAEETGNPPAVMVEYDVDKVGTLMPEVMATMEEADMFAGDLIAFETDSAITEKINNYSQAIIGGMITPEEACKDLAAAVK